jgi:hypothetical protein
LAVNNPPEIIYESDRRFEVVTYGVGHRGLVLRTIPEPGQHSRIEVWFKPASAVCLEPWLEGIQITRGAADTSACRKVIGRPIRAGEELFSVRSGEGLGWVLAGSVHGREDHQDAYAPPLFDGWGLKPGERDLFSVTANA